MKRLLVILFLAGFTTIVKSQDLSSIEASKQMLKEFYTAYNIAWTTNKGYILVAKLEALQKKYCTAKEYKEVRTLFKKAGLDHDILINDEATTAEDLKTLSILKAAGKQNEYSVIYVYHGKDASGKMLELTNEIHVTVAKENGSFKIAKAYGDQIH